MDDFANLVANHSDKVTAVLISDLHLSPFEPAPNLLVQAFLQLLNKLIALPNLQQLFILGDWFEVWLGDDVSDTPFFHAWLEPIIDKLNQLNQNGCQIYVMHGNRDFLIGQKFCDKFGGKLIQEPFYLTQNGLNIRLEHGDALCTDDKAYQRFRKVIQHLLTKKLLLALPMKKREQIADNLREKSQSDNAKKSMQIMDVNEQAVSKALENADVLIHGHTHRPAEHRLMNGKKRMVLGDWQIKDNETSAVIGIIIDNKLILLEFSLN